MDQGVVIWTEGPTDSGATTFLLLVFLLFGSSTFLLGCCLSRCCLAPKLETGKAVDSKNVAAWEKLKRKAVFFVNRRRRVSLALGA